MQRLLQALRKMGAFNKRRKHPRAAQNPEVEEGFQEKVSLQLVHLHDQVNFYISTLSLSQTMPPTQESEDGVCEISQFCPQLTSLYLESPDSTTLANLPYWTNVRY